MTTSLGPAAAQPLQKWSCVISAILTGWLVFLLTLALLLILGSVIAATLGIKVKIGDTYFLIEVIIGGIASLVLAALLARTSYKWFLRRSAMTTYLVLTFLIVLAALSIPAKFGFLTTQ